MLLLLFLLQHFITLICFLLNYAINCYSVLPSIHGFLLAIFMTALLYETCLMLLSFSFDMCMFLIPSPVQYLFIVFPYLHMSTSACVAYSPLSTVVLPVLPQFISLCPQHWAPLSCTVC